ncbi:hypothetical protein GGF50DRAFT_121089 [Schizophyllum commune]
MASDPNKTILCFLLSDCPDRVRMAKQHIGALMSYMDCGKPDKTMVDLMVAAVSDLQLRYTKDIAEAAVIYRSKNPHGIPAGHELRTLYTCAHAYGPLTEAEQMASEAGYPVHQLRDLFFTYGTPHYPGFPPGEQKDMGGPPSNASSDGGRAHPPCDPTAPLDPLPRGGIQNFCRVLVPPSPERRTASPNVSELENEYVADGGKGLALRDAPLARTPGCASCVAHGRRCIPTGTCCAACDGLPVRYFLPRAQERSIIAFNTAAQALISEVNHTARTLPIVEQFGAAMALLETERDASPSIV